MIGMIYDFTSVFIMALTAVLFVVSVISGGEIHTSHYAVTLFCTALSVLPFHLKSRGRAILAGITAALLGGIILSVNPGERMEFLRNSIWVLWVLSGCIFCVLFGRLAKKNRKLRIIPAVAGIAVLVICFIRDVRVEKMPVLMVLLLIVLTIVELLQEGWIKEGDTDPEAHVVFLLPFIILMFLMMNGMKASDQPYNWKFVRDFARDVRYRFELIMESLDLKQSWDEGDAEVGFSEEGTIFGNVGSSSYNVFQVTTGAPAGTKIYLTGKSFDTFDGRKWVKQDDSDADYRMYDVLETTAAVLTYDPEHVQDYIRNGLMTVDSKGLRTIHVFAPTKYVPELRDQRTEQIGGDLCFPKKQQQKYSVEFIRLNREYEGFARLLETTSSRDIPLSDETLSAAADLIPGQDLSEYTVKGLQEYRKKIHEVYGQKPVLSEEMEQFLETELRGTESSYEKLQRIESLLAGMQYTKKPGELPAEVDSAASFLDHLVLETKRGYCTHFATAFVLLARAEGIPARYVQGYTFPISSGLTEVMSNQAHAWPEAYIDGIGWIVFEPTPGFRKFSGWNVTDGKEEEGKDAYNPYDHYADKKENSSEYIENPKPAETDETIKWFSEKLYIPLLLTVLFLVVFIPADLLARRIRYVKLSDRKKVVYQFARILRVLKHIGLVSEDGETLSEFSARAENEIPEWNHAIFERYEDIIYGEQAVSSSDMKLFETGYKELLKIWIRRWRTKRIGKEASSETKE